MPDAQELHEDKEFAPSEAEDDDRQIQLLLAGFRACAKEAIRFLLEEEGLSPDHPLPAGLNEHLVRQHCHLAGSLHNDSGVGLDDSFISSPTDSDTRTDMNHLNSENTPELSADKNCSEMHTDSHVMEVVEQTLEFIRSQIESDYRTEMCDSEE